MRSRAYSGQSRAGSSCSRVFQRNPAAPSDPNPPPRTARVGLIRSIEDSLSAFAVIDWSKRDERLAPVAVSSRPRSRTHCKHSAVLHLTRSGGRRTQ